MMVRLGPSCESISTLGRTQSMASSMPITTLPALLLNWDSCSLLPTQSLSTPASKVTTSATVGRGVR